MAKECKHGRIEVDFLQWFVADAVKNRWCPKEDKGATFKVTDGRPDDVSSSYFRKARCHYCGASWDRLEDLPAFLYQKEFGGFYDITQVTGHILACRTVDQMVEGFDQMFEALREEDGKLEAFAEKFQSLLLKHQLLDAVKGEGADE